MLDDLDKTLRKLLTNTVAGLDEGQISFKPPDDSFAADTAQAVNLFLYDVRENRELRSNEWLSERQSNGTSLRRRSPVRVDCAYLITAAAGDPSSEHGLLGKVMLALLRHPTIPREVLQGVLAREDNGLPTSVLQANNMQSLSEFWQAIRSQPRAALSYTVTISIDPYESLETPLVREHIIAMRPDVTQGAGE